MIATLIMVPDPGLLLDISQGLIIGGSPEICLVRSPLPVDGIVLYCVTCPKCVRVFEVWKPQGGT